MKQLPYTRPYDPAFLGDGLLVPLPTPHCKDQLLNDGQALNYIHYSLVMHQNRKTALYVAHNLDMSQKKVIPRTDSWFFDKRIPKEYQVGAAGAVLSFAPPKNTKQEQFLQSLIPGWECC